MVLCREVTHFSVDDTLGVNGSLILVGTLSESDSLLIPETLRAIGLLLGFDSLSRYGSHYQELALFALTVRSWDLIRLRPSTHSSLRVLFIRMVR
jgi:hypothetical protein